MKPNTKRTVPTFEQVWKKTGGDKQLEGKIEPEAVDAYMEAMRAFYDIIVDGLPDGD